MATKKHIDHLVGMTVNNFLNPNNDMPTMDDLRYNMQERISRYNMDILGTTLYHGYVNNREGAIIHRIFLMDMVLAYIDTMALLDIEFMND